MKFLPDLAVALRERRIPIVVTGATGWLGKATLEMLETALDDDMPVLVNAYAASQRIIRLRSGRRVLIRPLATLAHRRGRPAVIFHFAFLTREHAATMATADYAAANRAISTTLLDFINRGGAAGLILPSSGATYSRNHVNNPYGALKYEDETNFSAAATRLGFPVAIIRIFNLAGPFINKLDSYALACIINDLRAGGPVTLRAAHPVWRGYTHVEDMLNIAAAIVLRRLAVPVFDTAGEAIEIGDLASRAARLLNRPDTEIHRPEWRHGGADRYLGDLDAYQRAADLTGVRLQSLDAQISATAAYLEHPGGARH